MIKKWLKRGVIVALIVLVLGGVFFGDDFLSYVKSSVKLTRETAKEAVPVEFELRRAKDLLEEIIPEMHANVRLIAEEEIEIAGLKQELQESDKSVADERGKVAKLRKAIDDNQETYKFGKTEYTRTEVVDELGWRFERFKEAQVVLKSKKRLLAARERSLKSAMELLEKTRSQKRILASRIEGLESQHRLVKATAIGTGIKVDNSKLAQTEKLIREIKKRLDVAERVLSHESHFVQISEIDVVDEKELLGKVDEYMTQN